ncbi:ADP-ribosylglycohydrolase family protein [Verrucomicrobium sp. BvORR034]|uniref:ADP-ribosylglycohydrolase family protein n=1 Tax=Verrucomicrobium sp. BvORR034 TaxID=1396418 RepID=UPI000B1369C3|nr:ADP-ribosylglycohydrolase family protein [Verrucomicrobium sp. BvORR034]
MMEKTPGLESQIAGSLWGAVVGDALGVPAEFRSRQDLALNPIVTMTGNGTHHQPPGTWSDDSSLIFCTLESLLECNHLVAQDMAERFLRWLRRGYWTPYGEVFDLGIATRQALARFAEGRPVARCGGREEFDNGNGSLMRLIPVSLWVCNTTPEEAVASSHLASIITHAHPRSQMVCGFFTIIVRGLYQQLSPLDALKQAWSQAEALYSTDEEFHKEWPSLHQMHPDILPHMSEAEVPSSGYCVHTLEAAVWTLLHTTSFEECVLRAVNLGEDTDTTGCVAGALAGLVYGIEAVPAHWTRALARHEDVTEIISRFTERITRR